MKESKSSTKGDHVFEELLSNSDSYSDCFNEDLLIHLAIARLALGDDYEADGN